MSRWITGAVGIVLAATLVVSCSDLADPQESITHPAGWTQPGSQNFHGQFVLESPGKSDTCATCHGGDFAGAATGVSCFSSGCHTVYPHPEAFANTSGANLHEVAVAVELGWDLSTCQTCHGANYDGEGYPSKNCLTCHTQENGPEACNTCHGSDESPAPPEDLSGNTATTAAGVGAHEHHVEESELTDILTPACTHCHNQPATYDAAGHIDGGPPSADIVFSSFATANGTLTPDFDPVALTCSNVYCHGAFSFSKSESENQFIYTEDAITGNFLTMRWTDVGNGQDDCGTCHGLPPTGHELNVTCVFCHARVVDPDLNIINPSLHINGQIDVF